MSEKFRIRVCSDLDYEEMVADICYEDCTVAMITQEKGIDHMEVTVYSPKNNEKEIWVFYLDEFLNVLQKAKKRLIEMQKLPE